MQTLTITKTISGIENIFNSEEVKSIFDGYAPSEIARAKKVTERVSVGSVQAYIVEVDPKSNYGRSTRVFKQYKTENGVNHLKEIDAVTALTSGGLRRVEIQDDQIIFTDDYFKKSQENLKRIGKTNFIVS